MYLNCHSYYSLRYGTLSPQQLVSLAQSLGVTALALTDINNTSAAGEFVKRCKAAGIKPLLGIDFRGDDGQCRYIGIAKNAEGFCQLNKYLSDHSLDGKILPDVFDPSPLTSHPSLLIIYPRLVKPISQFKEHEFLGIRPEHAHLANDGPLQMKVSQVEQLGSTSILHGHVVADAPFEVILPGQTTIQRGDTVRVTAPSEHLHYFDQNGLRI